VSRGFGARLAAVPVFWLALAVMETSPGAAQVVPAGPVVRLMYRSLQPGEPLIVFLENSNGARWASVTFLGRTARLRPAPGGGRTFAFLGIDLGTKPGPQALIVKVYRTDGTAEVVRKDLEIADKKFPFAKLELKKEYVTPPASVQERIRREAEMVALATGAVTPEWLGDGPFVPPHDAPSWSNFGQRRLNNNVLESIHTGLDLRVPFGERIRAANAGRVAIASDLYLGGKTVIIDHGLGVYSFYGHLSALRVRRGEAVKKGATIGLCGSTGRSTGPHLHWSFKVLETRVDPEAMLRLPIEK